MSAYFCGAVYCDVLAAAAAELKYGAYLPEPVASAPVDVALPPGAAAVPGLVDWWQRRQHPERLQTRSFAADVWAVLMLENVRSLDARYGDGPDMSGGEITAGRTIAPGLRYACPGVMPGAAAVLRILQTYTYQSCESAEWPRSVAFAVCEAIEREQVDRMIRRELGTEGPAALGIVSEQAVHPNGRGAVISLADMRRDIETGRAAAPGGVRARTAARLAVAAPEPAAAPDGPVTGPGGVPLW